MKHNGSAPDFRRRAATLFDQQLWCFGRDIVRPEGNVLFDLGMCQYRPLDPSLKSTLYSAAVEPGGSVFLWGFGAMYAEPGLGGVFVRRYDFAPRLSSRESAVGVFKSGQLGLLTNAVSTQDHRRLRTLLPRLVGWFARYEHWVAENYGTAYREHCLATRGVPNAVAAHDMAHDWERVAKKCKHYRESNSAPADPWKKFLHQLRSPIAAARTMNSRPSTWGKS